MAEGNGKIDKMIEAQANVPVFDLLVRWSPSGQIQVVWPPIDDVARLGMLEMAKTLLYEARQKAARGDHGLVVPAAQMPKLG